MVMVRRAFAGYSGIIFGVLLFLAGCASQVGPRPGQSLDGLAPALVVERFLNAVNSSDLDTMARLFGTRDGSVVDRDPRSEVEVRMHALATIMRHEEYQLEGEGLVPGRLGEAVELEIRMVVGDREALVPFVVVRTRRGAWLIEQIGIERITSGRY